MTRLLFACSEFGSHGGIQRFNRNLLRAWSDLQLVVDVVSLNDPPAAARQAGDEALARYCGAGRSKLRWMKALWGCLHAERYDRLVCGHLNLAPALLPALQSRNARRAETLLILHGVEAWDRVHGLRRMAATRFDRILPVSHYTARDFLRQVPGFPPDRIAVLPNTVGTHALPDNPVPKPTIMPDNLLRILSVARLSRTEQDKGLRHVLDALKLLPDGLHAEYVIVGDGDDRTNLESYAKGLGIADRVTFRGSLGDRDLWTEYQLADVFILPSRKEGFGIVFLEAMHFGLPVVGAAEKGTLDVIRDGHNGFLVPFGDPLRLRDRIRELATSPELRQRLGAAGKALVCDHGPFGASAFRNRCSQLFCADPAECNP